MVNLSLASVFTSLRGFSQPSTLTCVDCVNEAGEDRVSSLSVRRRKTWRLGHSTQLCPFSINEMLQVCWGVFYPCTYVTRCTVCVVLPLVCRSSQAVCDAVISQSWSAFDIPLVCVCVCALVKLVWQLIITEWLFRRKAPAPDLLIQDGRLFSFTRSSGSFSFDLYTLELQDISDGSSIFFLISYYDGGVNTLMIFHWIIIGILSGWLKS